MRYGYMVLLPPARGAADNQWGDNPRAVLDAERLSNSGQVSAVHCQPLTAGSS